MIAIKKPNRAELNRVRIELYCHNCDHIVLVLLDSDTRDVMFPKCKSLKVYSYPCNNSQHQLNHYDRLIKTIRAIIKKQNKMAVRSIGRQGYTLKSEWLNDLYDE